MHDHMGKQWVGGFFLFFILATTNLCSGADNTTSGCLEHDRQALLQFKRSLASDPSGRLSSWTGNNCCQWQGVGCDNATGYVTKLDLGNDLSDSMEANELNSSLAELTRLSYLDLSGMNFRGNLIPEFIGPLPVKCDGDDVLESGRNAKEDDDDDVEKIWVYSTMSGFTTGFMGIFGILVLKKRWRIAFFNFVGGYIGKKLYGLVGSFSSSFWQPQTTVPEPITPPPFA
ncbi:hypothetical protein L2E82_31677 [Cichorium intybus]|uniref:Uncharacterized protein n=1 Tax=Cichorium intybus TaxID=13427 RepID=A0ACB9BFX3_CICIN|nr:hypothetical protein L2E82_31677 [Cichorium intybus]